MDEDDNTLSRIALLALFVTALLAGCSSPAPDPAVGDGPLEVPRPDLSALDEASREAVEIERAELDTVLEDPSATAERRAVAYAEAGMMYQAYGLYDAAEVCYRNVLDLDPGDYRWQYYLAQLYLDQESYEKASSTLVRVIE
ncbi:MAG: tetratricopeptide repeat protein, partial [Acidobacteriota bacterium]|nr:tetratricopeptide repeat protein [Acidobacteriota bacterium]